MERGESSERGAGRGDEGHWLGEWRVHARLLRSALRSGATEGEMQKLLSNCFSRYSDCLSLRTVSERRGTSLGTSLEAAFTWLGGWRPSCAVVMVSSLLKAEVGVVSAAITRDESNFFLTEEQLALLESLQKRIRQSELDFSNQLSLLQMLVADQSMLSALTVYSESSSSRASVEDVMENKVVALKGLLKQADRLRLRTLEDIWHLLTPVQAARASVAAFEIVFMMRSMDSNSTLMRSMSASEATLEHPIVVDMIPTVQNLVVPVHAGLALEDSFRPVTLSFPIVPAPVLTGAVEIQSSGSYLSGVTPGVQGHRPSLDLESFVNSSVARLTIIEKATQTVASGSSTPEIKAPIGTVDLDNNPSSGHTETVQPFNVSTEEEVLPSSKSSHA